MKLVKKIAPILLAAVCMTNVLYGANLESISANNTTLIPLRVVGEALQAQIGFDQVSGQITITYGERVVGVKAGSTQATINGESKTLEAAPRIVDGTTYVPLRFIGEALGAKVTYDKGKVQMSLGDMAKEWTLVHKSVDQGSKPTQPGIAFQSKTQTIQGKTVKYVVIDMRDQRVSTRIHSAGNKINQATDLKILGQNSTLAVNGTYFAAYNGATPYPDGTLVKDGKPLHITDIGCTIGFTEDNQVLIDFVQTRVQGYINDEPSWTAYRVNRPTSDVSATVIYTPEYGSSVSLAKDRVGVVCAKGQVVKKVTGKVTIPQDGFVLVMNQERSGRYSVGDRVRYEVTYTPQNTGATQWQGVTQALSAGPSLLIGGKPTPLPSKEGFTEAKILTQVAARTFIGTTADQRLIVGTTTASITQLKEIAKALGLVNAMCLDGGASSGLYYKGEYITSPGRQINNSITFSYD